MIAFYSHVICNIASVMNSMLVYGWRMIQTQVGWYITTYTWFNEYLCIFQKIFRRNSKLKILSIWTNRQILSRYLILFLSIIKWSGCLNSIKKMSFKISKKVFKGFLLCNVIYCSPFIEITYHNNYKHTEGMTTYVFPFWCLHWFHLPHDDDPCEEVYSSLN